VIACDPYRGTAEVVDPERLLRRRHALIERARTAATVGVLLSTKSGQRREALARRLVALAPDRAVAVSIEEVTPDALLNLGFDAYVNTACPRLAYDDEVRFPVPVLAPPEFECAMGARSWDDYVVDECE
jgi:2-(3-amino-3-carboxypropyl)histidine synthase